MNPLQDLMGSQTGPLNEVIKMMNGGMRPEFILNQMVQNNPEVKHFLQNMQAQANGRSPRDLALQFAKQQGVSEQEILRFANRLGLK